MLHDFSSPHPGGPTTRPELEFNRPDAAVLCYPVVSLTTEPHIGSRDNFLGSRVAEPGLTEALSNELRVDAQTGPVFIWQAADDAAVPVSHSLGLAATLGAFRIPYELHIYPKGGHGLGLAKGHGAAQEWTAACLRWLSEQGVGPDSRN